MTNITGFNAGAATAAIENIIGSDPNNTDPAVAGANIILIGEDAFGTGDNDADYNMTEADIDNISAAEKAVQTLSTSEFTISTSGEFGGAGPVATLSNDADVEFGPVDIAVVDDIVIQSVEDGNLFIVANEPNNPNLTGEEVTLPANTTLYELGDPQ